LFGFLGLNPVLVAKENFVTQLSNFLGAALLAYLYAPLDVGYAIGLAVVTSLVIEALKELSRSTFSLLP
jgi:hypothetical protein